MNTEHHPFKPFVPDNMEMLIVGSFPGKEQTQSDALKEKWFYGAPRNMFWKILEGVYDTELKTQPQKQALLESRRIGVTDIILKAERKLNSNLDENLSVIEWNDKAVAKIIKKYDGVKVLCTSRFVEKYFRKFFPSYTNVTVLPSPSPRYARMSLQQKIDAYKNLLPQKEMQ